MKRNGLYITDLKVKPVVTLDFHETTFGDWLTREALKHEIATKEELDKWNKDLSQKTEQGEFYSCVNMVLLAGKKCV